MIRVIPAPEPATFDDAVRQPGLSAIDELVGRTPRLKRKGRRRVKIAAREEDIPADRFPPFWRGALTDLMSLYQSQCAYLAMHIAYATGNPTVDHALPKSLAWDHVYEWSNYRLCAGVVNSKKGELMDLVDPFDVRAGWFTLNLNTFFVERGASAPKKQWRKIDRTLPLLNLRQCWKDREEYVKRYELGPGAQGIDLTFLEHRAPFIAFELRRQGRLVRGDT